MLRTAPCFLKLTTSTTKTVMQRSMIGVKVEGFYHTHLSHQRIVSAPYLILSSLAMIPVVPLLGAVRGMPLSRIMLIGMKIHEDFEKSLQACKLLFSTRNFCSMFSSLFILVEYFIAKFETCFGKQFSQLEQQYLNTIQY